jgi:hypothetical protein
MGGRSNWRGDLSKCIYNLENANDPADAPLAVKTAAPSVPAYERVKRYVLDRIQYGVWKEGDAIPGEEALAR